ncbi:MAG: 7-carboxy-7-deazaguanine synthase QueE [Myxococcota bacterium]|nr:7-carboxy-7-deazaguanine synthase QueE [Myxococcota bacterium]
MSSAGGSAEAHLVEVFSSVQGEGPDVGRSTLFVRFGECDLRCRWCDSPGTWRRSERFEVESPEGGEPSLHPNPVAVSALLDLLAPLDPERHQMIAFTGGEPLLQPEAVGELARAIGPGGPERLLETHGLHHRALAQVVDAIDVVSMDWKLTSEVRRESDPAKGDVEPFHEAHERFLEVARGSPRVVVKLVVTPSTTDAEFDRAVAGVAAVHPGAHFVVQPVTPCGGVKERPPAERLLALARRAEARLENVRLVPQTHPIYGVR